MISWLGKIFGTGKALEQGLGTVDKVADGAMRGLDALFYTPEEKSADSIKVTGMRMKMAVDMQDQFSPRSISRRVLAFLFCGIFSIFSLTALVFTCLGKLATAKDIVVLAVKLQIPWIVMTVVIFYFGYYGIKAILKKS